MKYSTFLGSEISTLGFGTMRLPTLADGSIDKVKTSEMIDYAIKNGVNYFDTAYPYHGGMSERVVGEILSYYPRESFFLATKFPGHQIADAYNPKAIFEEQLRKCRVDYFDFYLLHNVYEKSIEVYEDKRWSILDYFLEQKRLGKIKHLGFSTHARPENLRAFLEKHSSELDFCQIQLNYLDYTLQDAKQKYEMLCQYNIPVIVMEPVRGGRLAHLDEQQTSLLQQLRPTESIPSWAFRWLLRFDNVKVILSGMSSMEQVKDNIKTFGSDKPLTDDEFNTLLSLAEKMKNSLPCTGCRYCCDGCPQGLDIPTILNAYNDIRFGYEGSLTATMHMEALPKEKHPSSCIGCGACASVCPQNIDIPKAMQEITEDLKKLPSWKQICIQRAIDNERNSKK